jgi:hypothetical protein
LFPEKNLAPWWSELKAAVSNRLALARRATGIALAHSQALPSNFFQW